MKSVSLRTTTALALVLGATAAYAQVQQKEPGSQGSADRQGQVQSDKGAGEKATQGDQREPRNTQGATQTEPRDKAGQGKAERTGESQQKQKSTTQKSAEPKDSDQKGRTQKSAEPKDTTPKGSTQKSAEPKDGSGKGTAQKGEEPGQRTKEKAADKASPADQGAKKASGAPRAQLSEQQRSRVRDTLVKQKAERITNVNFSISVGSRVPRSVRLVVLPPEVIVIVPEYRDYRYVLVRDEIIIVEPTTYEIVAVIPAGGSVAGGGSAVQLSLSNEQRTFILRNVDLRGESRLGIGGVTIGIDVPQNVELREFPSVVVERVPDVRSYRYFVFENDLAIVDPRGSKVVLVIEGNR